jgi:hypothetical protein
MRSEHDVARIGLLQAAIATSSSDIGVSSAFMPVISSPDRLSLIAVDAIFDQLYGRRVALPQGPIPR